MSKITHAATRAAFGTAIDGVLKYVSRDRKETYDEAGGPV